MFLKKFCLKRISHIFMTFWKFDDSAVLWESWAQSTSWVHPLALWMSIIVPHQVLATKMSCINKMASPENDQIPCLRLLTSFLEMRCSRFPSFPPCTLCTLFPTHISLYSISGTTFFSHMNMLTSYLTFFLSKCGLVVMVKSFSFAHPFIYENLKQS